MSILGTWFKKDTKKRLEGQRDAGRVEDEKNVDAASAESSHEEKPARAKKSAKKSDEAKAAVQQVTPILLRPHITEKAASEQSQGVYTFMVAPNTTKNEIAKAIARTYNVQPKKIRVMNMRGKTVRWGRFYGKRTNWKKAVVYLKAGDTMIIHEGT